MLVIEDEVVEYAHHRTHCEDGCFLMDRHARRAVDRIGFEDAARLLGGRRMGDCQREQPCADCRAQAQCSRHFRLLAGEPPIWRLSLRLPGSWRRRGFTRLASRWNRSMAAELLRTPLRRRDSSSTLRADDQK